MSRAVVTMNVGDYAPEIRGITYPLMRHYAHKIGAEFHEITERKWPEWPVVYEKLQMREILEDGGFEQVMFMDADTMVFPDTPDWLSMIPLDTVACYGFDWAPVRLNVRDPYFHRDGRMIGWAGWLTIASHLTADLWTPLDQTVEEAMTKLSPTVGEVRMGMQAGHLVDDYCLSRNVARFGLKATTVQATMKQYAQEGNWYWHRYDVPHKEKASYMQMILTGGTILPDGETEPKTLPGWHVPISMLKGGPAGGYRNAE